MVYLIIFIVVFVAATYFVMSQEVFGAEPKGERLEKILSSKNYKDKQFQNQSFTPQIAEGFSMPKVMFSFLFGKKDPLLKPSQAIPAIHTDLNKISDDEDVFIWMGHSSYFIKIDGVSFLIDPVLSTFGSPFKFFNKAFEGSDLFKPQDIPNIDYLVITHDHYDHLDFPTVKAIREKSRKGDYAFGSGSSS
ncbi:MBL fold metallo-hydrolase [Chryseobacterium indoltheticum]|uniref:MBL fold metallo-hydrolase n=1 Tax=Chryseobacterium indoltheticum TaxID=254 RepID=UPI003F49496D